MKKRYWTFVLYPDSAPVDWLDILISTGLPISISPFHDKDINPDKTPKKPHYHILLCYAGPTTYENVCKLTKDVLKQTIPQPCDCVRGLYRYFTHKDNPEKFQYNESDIMNLNSFYVSDFIDFTKTEVLELKKRVQNLIYLQDITEYSDLCDYLLDNDMPDEYEICVNNTLFFNTYISSRRNKKRSGN